MPEPLESVRLDSLAWGQLRAGQKIGQIAAVFPRIDAKPAIEQMRELEAKVSVEQAVRTLSSARNLILDGRLRYHRHSLDLPVCITTADGKRLQAHLLNLSQGGLAIQRPRPTALQGPIQISLTLPGSKFRMKATGEVVWTQQGAAGIRFVEMKARINQQLQLWLAQQYLTH
jgi:hypothetical protein